MEFSIDLLRLLPNSLSWLLIQSKSPPLIPTQTFMRFPPLESHELFLLDDYDEEHTGAHAQERLAQLFLPPPPTPPPKE